MTEIITCTGYGFTGSSAATNILEEFENIESLNAEFECTFLHEPDGIQDLENALREGHRLKCDLAIKRFLRLANTLNKQRPFRKYFNNNFVRHSEAFIDSICTAHWNGNWHRGSDTIKLSKEDLLYYNLAKQVFLNEYSYSRYSLFEPDTWHPAYHIRNKSYYAHFTDSFYYKAQEYVGNLIAEIALRVGPKKILIDQFFPAYNISAYLNYAPDTKIIIVDRDPRDMYVLNKSSWGESYIPTDNVDVFINWYRGIRFSQKKEALNTNVILFRFEDFVFNYENSLERLKIFLSLKDEEHIKKLNYFDPAQSIKNTYKFKNYPQWKDDVLKIEHELPEYCYHFPDEFTGSKEINVDTNKPIEDYIKSADVVHYQKILPLKYKNKLPVFLFGMTNFGEALKSLAHRNTLTTKIKGLIKCGIFIFSFLIEYAYAVCIYRRYGKVINNPDAERRGIQPSARIK